MSALPNYRNLFNVADRQKAQAGGTHKEEKGSGTRNTFERYRKSIKANVLYKGSDVSAAVVPQTEQATNEQVKACSSVRPFFEEWVSEACDSNGENRFKGQQPDRL